VTSPRLKQPTEADSPAGIRERGALGAALLTMRAAAGQVVAFASTIVLAHLLSPTAFGVVAFGATVVAIGNFFADGGLGMSLIRKATDPTVDELRTLLALQLMAALVIALGLALAGSRTGTAGSRRSNSRSRWSTPVGRSPRSGRAGVSGALPLPRSSAPSPVRC